MERSLCVRLHQLKPQKLACTLESAFKGLSLGRCWSSFVPKWIPSFFCSTTWFVQTFNPICMSRFVWTLHPTQKSALHLCTIIPSFFFIILNQSYQVHWISYFPQDVKPFWEMFIPDTKALKQKETVFSILCHNLQGNCYAPPLHIIIELIYEFICCQQRKEE